MILNLLTLVFSLKKTIKTTIIGAAWAAMRRFWAKPLFRARDCSGNPAGIGAESPVFACPARKNAPMVDSKK
jgi:hypothetical protein